MEKEEKPALGTCTLGPPGCWAVEITLMMMTDHREVQSLAPGHTAGLEQGLSDWEACLYPRPNILQIN